MSVVHIASWAWSSVNAVVRATADFVGVKSDLGVPVVSIGNLQAGGSGKTPITIEIARELKKRGKQVWILTRGYGSELESSYGVLAGMTHTHPLSAYGDEAPLLAEHSGAVVIVGADRVGNFHRYRATGAACDVVLLDDGLQQFRLKKTLDVICVTSAKPGQIFFRERRSSWRDSEWVIETKGPAPFALPEGRTARVKLVSVVSEATRGKSGWLITGIGQPSHLVQNLESSGIKVVDQTLFPDHHDFSEEEVTEFVETARARGLTIFLTEKDALKWKPFVKLEEQGIVTVGYECEWLSGKDELFQAIWKNCFASPYSS